MMKTKSTIKRTKRGYTLRLTKLEFDELRAMVGDANSDFGHDERLESMGAPARVIRASQDVTALICGY